MRNKVESEKVCYPKHQKTHSPMGRLVSGWAVVTAAMAALLVLAAEANPLLTASLETAPPPGVPDRVVNAETTDLVFVLDSTEALVFDAAAVEASLADLFTPSQPVEALVDFGTHAGGSGPFSYFLTLRNATLSPNGLLVLRAVPGLFFNTEMPPVTNLYSNTVTVCGAPCCANTEWGIQGVVLDSGECRCGNFFLFSLLFFTPLFLTVASNYCLPRPRNVACRASLLILYHHHLHPAFPFVKH